MDIDLGDQVMDGIDLSEEILKIRNLPILFVSSHNDPKILGKIEKVLSYGFVSKNTDIAVLDTSIKIALKLHAETSPYEGRGT
jgi:DNA-binding NarL/FixJ family response regulator